MKTILFALLVLCASIGYAQDVDTVAVYGYYRDTLTATLDTMQIQAGMPGNSSYYTVTAKTTTGTDSVEVWTKSVDGIDWVQHGVTDLSTGVDATQIVVTTTPIEFYILDTSPKKIRLIRPSNDAGSTIFIVAGKR